MEIDQQIREAYQEYIKQNAARPEDLSDFAGEMELDQETFGCYYSHYCALEQAIIRSYLEETITKLKGDTTFAGFSTGERLVSFMYTWLEVLSPHRDFVKFVAADSYGPVVTSLAFGPTRKVYKTFVSKLLEEGVERGEIANRFFVNHSYTEVGWLSASMLIDYWLQDESEDFQDTDAAVEKTVLFGLEVMQPNAIESGIDLVKFLFKGLLGRTDKDTDERKTNT